MNTEAQNHQLKQEIEELREKIATLKESEERFRLISSVTTDYTFSTKVMPDGTLDLNWVAGAFESISGYSLEEFKARGGWRATIHPDDGHIDDNDFTRLRNNQDTESQIRTINRNGEIVWVQVFAHPVWNKEKNCLAGIYGAVKNITDKKKSEHKLIKSERHFRELLEKVSLIAVILDAQGKVTFCNDHLLKLTGYQPEELIGKDWFDLMIPDGINEVKEVFLTGLQNGKVNPRFENPILTKSGEKLDIVWSNATQHKSNGVVTFVASIGEDVTERKRAEETLKNKDRLLHLTGEMAKVGGWEFDAKTMKGSWSNEVAKIHALDPDSETNVALGISFYDGESRILIEKAIEKAISNQESYDLTLKMTDDNGVEKWVRTIGVPVVEESEVVKLQGTFQDVTELKNVEEELISLNQELEKRVFERTLELENRSRTLEEKEIVLTNTIKNLNLTSEELQKSSTQLETANKELEAFSYSVSHDLRAPLRAINGFVNILNEEYTNILDDEGKRICSIIHSNAVKMGQLIDDLLSFSRLIRSELHHSMIDMQGVVHSLIAEFQSSKELNPNTISLQELPQSTGDTNLIKQVWTNLISNAIKYSSKTTNPQIIIGASQNEIETIYFIKDNGVGFNMNYSHKLFGVFQRLHGANEFEGTGVGLAIVQRIITRHGGRVWAESEIGKGAVFYFSLPRNNT